MIRRLFLAILILSAIMTIGCGKNIFIPKKEPQAPLFNNLGNLHHPITTKSDLAQRYFNQGLTLAYAFNHKEAERSFKAATTLDSTCAMCWWGIALALGPNINAPMFDEAVPQAYSAIFKAIQLSGGVTEKERDYIGALEQRYVSIAVEDRSKLDISYADAMRDVAKKYPDDLDASALFAESLMDLIPWKYWTNDYKARPEAAEALAALQRILKVNPYHIGANHFYIHLVEQGSDPSLGVANAERLGYLAPGAGHLVHMPCHIYVRTGRYHDCTEANRRAIMADEEYIKVTNAQGYYPLLYYPHNFHSLWFSTMMEGNARESIGAAMDIQIKMTDRMIEVERLRPTLLFALLRFGRWEDILVQPQPREDMVYYRAMWHYARGISYLRKHMITGAGAELERLERLASSDEAKALKQSFFFGLTQVNIALNILRAEVNGKQGNIGKMIDLFKDAVALEDSLPYMEPPYWYYPVRHSLGAAYLTGGRPDEAEKVFMEDIKRNPENGWALYGLMLSLQSQGKINASIEVERRFNEAWSEADININALFYED